MKGQSGFVVSAKRAAQDAWQAPLSNDGTGRHVRYLWIKRGGTSGTSGSGPSGYKRTPSHLLQRALAERPGVSANVKARQAQRVAAKATPVRLWGGFWGLDKHGQRTGITA